MNKKAMTPDELKAIRERCEKATPDWEVSHGGCIKGGRLIDFTRGSSRAQIALFMGSEYISDEERMSNAEFASHARTDIPKLLDEVERLQEKRTHLSAVALANHEAIKKENARLRQALEFYGNEQNYYQEYDDMVSPIVSDDGAIARAALERK
jgi:hypothetical protein